MSYLVRITFTTKGYTTMYERNGTAQTRDDVEPWINSEMAKVSSGSNSTYENVRVYIGEVQEEYTAQRIWELTPIGNTRKPAKASDTKAIEI